MKKIIVVITVCFLVFWTGRIISVNQNPPITKYYEIGDILDCGDLEVSFIETHLDTPEQFKERFGVESNTYDGEHKVISICISATNKSDAYYRTKGILDKGYITVIIRRSILWTKI